MDTFDRFVLERKEDLKRIARRTKGEHSYNDVVNEAWLMARAISARKCVPADFLDPSFQRLLLSHLYQHLVRYTELNVRHAIRLDPARSAGDEQPNPHPLLNMLASDDGNDPLSFLIATEAQFARPSTANERHSLASAYLILLNHFGNRMYSVARHLLISTSHAYRCCAEARLITTHQHALELSPPVSLAMMKPWRRQRAPRAPRQMAFDFEERLPFLSTPMPIIRHQL
ncbi:hypothetical protein [Luteibacter sp.]|jgi:hypothetical protein|uniref:hypothetical protein n=1 Tax=Luteibacter sp. TaxID=1886636 RepID=UPI002F4147BA